MIGSPYQSANSCLMPRDLLATLSRSCSSRRRTREMLGASGNVFFVVFLFILMKDN